MSSGSSNKKESARQARLAQEAAQQAAKQRNQRLAVFGGVVAAIALVFVILLAAGVFKNDPTESGSPTKVKSGADIKGVSETNEMLKGIATDGLLLGDKNAKVTIHEFADLKCPACQQYQVGDQPQAIEKLVATGKANLQLHFINVIDPNAGTTDGTAARRVVYNLGNSKKAWAFVNLIYWNQGPEQDSWATDKKLAEIGEGAGITAAEINSKLTSTAKKAEDADAKMAKDLGVTGTPTVFVQPKGTRTYTRVDPTINALDPAVAKAAKSAK